MHAPLRGRVIAITRPAGQFDPLATLIRRAGGEPLAAPLLEIVPIPDNLALLEATSALDSFHYAIFISPNSVMHSLPLLLGDKIWPENIHAASIGPGTARALANAGINRCLLPEGHQFDSEGLLARPEFQSPNIYNRDVLLLKGEGGRELLADTLRSRGAKVHTVTCYRRRPAENLGSSLLAAWKAERLDAILISSSEALVHLFSALSSTSIARLKTTPVFVPHPRIAAKAQSLGLNQIVLTLPADEGTLAGLLAYNWPPP